MGFQTWAFIAIIVTNILVNASPMIDRSEKLIESGTCENDIAMLIERIERLETTVNAAIDNILGINVDKGDSDLEYLKTCLTDLDSKIYSLKNNNPQERKVKRSVTEYQTVISLIESMDTKLEEILLNNQECQVRQSENLQNTPTLANIDTVPSSVEDKLARIEFILIEKLVTSKSCRDVLKEGYTESGVYLIRIAPEKAPLKVYCDQKTDGGGWTVFQRRHDGSADFYRKWSDYKAGFGDLEGEFWLGNNIIHDMTTNTCCRELRVDLKDWEGATVYAVYSKFSIGSEKEYYKISISGYSGNASDSLSSHNGMFFSTQDARHEPEQGSEFSCSEYYQGAWWFTNCFSSHLNGQYMKKGQHGNNMYSGIRWDDWHAEKDYSLKFSEMKFR